MDQPKESKKMLLNGARVQIYETEQDVATGLCNLVIDSAREAISRRGVFTIGLSGGSAAKSLCDQLSKVSTGITVDWTKWRVFMCDERHVSRQNPDCTFEVYDKHLFKTVKIPDNCVFPSNSIVTVEEAARLYIESMRSVFCDTDLPRFDLLVLGMGPDGHTCSLFPDHPLLNETSCWIASISDSPKPPSQRITMTFPVLNNARSAVFAACGQSKADIVQRILIDKEKPRLPAGMVRLHDGQLYWLLDMAAASKLQQV